MCLAVPGKIVGITVPEGLERKGKVIFGGIIKEVNLACVPEAKVGEYVMVHVGIAIHKVDEGEAMKVFEYLNEINGLDEVKKLKDITLKEKQSHG
jgi:hydrogenase expression/formation protein HypC